MNALAGATLDHNSPVPLYYQAARLLEETIEDGRLPRGSKLESESDLAGRLGISRPTMRAAIKQLVDKGPAHEAAGHRGHSRPAARKARRRADQPERRPQRGLQGTGDLCAGVRGSSLPAGHRGASGSRAGRACVELRPAAAGELRGPCPDRPHAQRPPDRLADDRGEDLERTGLYELFRRSEIAPHVATQRIGARRAGAKEAEPLEIEPGDPVLTMTRITYDTGGRPIEYGWHRYPAESYWLEMMLVEL